MMGPEPPPEPPLAEAEAAAVRRSQRLVMIKVLHTLVWLFFNACFGLALYSGFVGDFGPLFWVPVGLILLESLVLVFNHWTCPMTPWAARYTDDRSDNFDISLPLWLARHNKTIFGTAYGLAVAYLVAATWGAR